MSKRANLPYTTQDLFPASAPSLVRVSHLVGPGLLVSNSSSFVTRPYVPKTTSSRLQNTRRMLRRLFKPTTLDFETAIWEIFHLIINPKKMYRSHYYYKQNLSSGKLSYTRDDPSFLLLLTAFLSVSAVAWGLAYTPRFGDIIKLVVYMVVVDFYVTGAVVATVSWFLTNKLFNNTYGSFGGVGTHNVNYIEWGFCFDIHCNSFLAIWCLLYLVQFVLLPLLTIQKSIVLLLLGNSLYFGAVGYYFVITFYGFNSLPFISSSVVNTGNSAKGTSPAKILQLVVLAGVLPLLAAGWLVTVLLGFNVAAAMVDTYFN